jgi:hypothetical protein
MPVRDITELSKPPASQPSTTTTVDSSGWDRWLRSHLDREFVALHRALGQLLATERQKFHDQLERKTRAFEVELAKLSGAIDVLRGAQPPPPAKFPTVKAWSADVSIYYEGEVVTCDDGTFQAQRDTARAPGAGTKDDWVCLAASGNGFTVRGTYAGDQTYKHFDVVMMNGSSFVALRDNPGPCPASGHWQLIASCGSRGHRGPEGKRGIMGLRGESGAAAPNIHAWEIDRRNYVATPIMADGSRGPPLQLRELFEQYFAETST